METRCNALSVAPDITLYHKGPPLDYGPLPSLFYFALSGPDSLCLDPFNQPVQFLNGKMIRIFSLTLPGHENGLPATQAMQVWAEDFAKGHNCVSPFLDSAQLALDFALRQQFVAPHKIAAAGLSRGGFIAAHLAAREEKIRYLLCFAPMSRLSKIKEFSDFNHKEQIDSLDTIHLGEQLADKQIQLYIGNHDTRVGTRDCFEFAMSIISRKKARSVQLGLTIYPSIGHMGHGTPPEIFKQGADWLSSVLLSR